MKKPRYTIAVTALNAVDSPGPGVAVIRGLREATGFDVRIIGLSYESLEPGIYMPGIVDKVYQIPMPSEGHEALLKRLEYIHQRERLDLIIPNFDAELVGFIRNRDVLAAMGVKMLVPTLEQLEERQKTRLSEFGERYDIKVPKNCEVLNIQELKKCLSDFDYPVMIKGKFYEAYVVYSEEQAQAYFYKITAKWGAPVIVQQFVRGQEFNLTGLGDGQGRLIGAVPMRKTYITQTGKGWAGISITDRELIRMAEKFVSRSKWPGGFELECIKEDQTGDLYLIEINPRFPAWVYLAVGCGQNHMEALVRIAMGEQLEPFADYEAGKMFVRYAYDLICDLNAYAEISTTGEYSPTRVKEVLVDN